MIVVAIAVLDVSATMVKVVSIFVPMIIHQRFGMAVGIVANITRRR